MDVVVPEDVTERVCHVDEGSAEETLILLLDLLGLLEYLLGQNLTSSS